MGNQLKIWMVITILAVALIASVAYADSDANTGPCRTDDNEKMAVIEGEILSVSDRRIDINTAGVIQAFTVGRDPIITMNGRPALLRALRPVADDCYFIGRICLDHHGVVRMVEGNYRGASVRILSATRIENGGSRLIAEDTEEDGEPQRLFETTPGCRGMERVLAEKKAVEAYILFDLQGKVRGIFF